MPGTDKFCNQATITVVESAANTLTFKKLETGISLFDKVAWVINRIEYFLNPSATIFNTTDDILLVGVTVANNITALSLTDPNVLDFVSLSRQDIGAAASGGYFWKPYTRDFAGMPGGGLITTPNPIYGAAVGTGLASASTSFIKIFYTVLELKTEEYWELVEARRIVSA